MDQIIRWYNLEREGGSISLVEVAQNIRDSGSRAPKYSVNVKETQAVLKETWEVLKKITKPKLQ